MLVDTLGNCFNAALVWVQILGLARGSQVPTLGP